MHSRPLLLIGGGGHSLVVAEAAHAAGLVVAGCFDDAPIPILTERLGIPRLGSIAEFAEREEFAWILGLGGTTGRRALLQAQRGIACTVIHPDSTIARSAQVGSGVFVGPRAVIHSCAMVQSHAILNTGCIIEHECEIGENVHVAPGAVLAGRVCVGPDTLIGLNATILPGVSIGRNCTIGAGAVVRANVPDGVTVVGVPARAR